MKLSGHREAGVFLRTRPEVSNMVHYSAWLFSCVVPHCVDDFEMVRRVFLVMPRHAEVTVRRPESLA